MDDLIRLARQRRAALHREVAELDRFVRTADALLRGALIDDSAATGTDRRTGDRAGHRAESGTETGAESSPRHRPEDLSDTAAPGADPFQARFNSGEVLPPLPPSSKDWADDRPGNAGPPGDEWVPVDERGLHFVRRTAGEG